MSSSSRTKKKKTASGGRALDLDNEDTAAAAAATTTAAASGAAGTSTAAQHLKKRQPSLFFRRDPKTGEYSPTVAFFVLSAALPLGFRSLKYAFLAIVVSLLLVLCDAVQSKYVDEQDRHEIRYDVLDSRDVLREMLEWEEAILTGREEDGKNGEDDAAVVDAEFVEKGRLVIRVGLNALAKKYGKAAAFKARRRQMQEELQKQQKGGGGGGAAVRFAAEHRDGEPDSSSSSPPDGGADCDGDVLALQCQEAAYVGLRCFPDDDGVVAASLSLLAVAAKDIRVRERHLYEADRYGLDLPVVAMRDALERAKDVARHQDEGAGGGGDGRQREQRCAELQRKGCLLLGALASTDSSPSSSDDERDAARQMASQVVGEGGIEALLGALRWYRHHADVANWALWAAFTLCYEDDDAKVAFVQLDGVAAVLQALRKCGPDSVEVARHGIAILFDLMRDDDGGVPGGSGRLDVWQIRSAAADAGLHDILLKAMNRYVGEMDVVMMGQEILIGTGYKGDDIPQFDPLAAAAAAVPS